MTTRRGYVYKNDSDSDAEVNVKSRSRSDCMHLDSKEHSSVGRLRHDTHNTMDGTADDMDKLLVEIQQREEDDVDHRDRFIPSAFTEHEVDPEISDVLDEIDAVDDKCRKPWSVKQDSEKKVNRSCSKMPTSTVCKEESESFAFLDDIFFDDFVKRSPVKQKAGKSKERCAGESTLQACRPSPKAQVKHSGNAAGKTSKESILEVDDLLGII